MADFVETAFEGYAEKAKELLRVKSPDEDKNIAIKAMEQIDKKIVGTYQRMASAIKKTVEQIATPYVTDRIKNTPGEVGKIATKRSKEAAEKGLERRKEGQAAIVDEGKKQASKYFVAPIKEFAEELPNQLKRIPKEATKYGGYIGDGLVAGLNKKRREAIIAMGVTGQGIIEKVQRLFKMRSPSLVMDAFGQNIVMGLVEGIKGTSGIAINVIQGLMGIMSDSADIGGIIRAETFQQLAYESLEAATNVEKLAEAQEFLGRDIEAIRQKAVVPIWEYIENYFAGYKQFGSMANKIGSTLFSAILDGIDIWVAAKVLPMVVGNIWNIVNTAIDATKELRAAMSTITFLSGSPVSGKMKQQWLEKTSLESGASIQSLAEGYGQLSAASVGTQMNDSDVQTVVQSMGKASLAYGLNSIKNKEEVKQSPWLLVL